MTKHVSLQKNYSLNRSRYQQKLPLNTETIIPENDSVRLLRSSISMELNCKRDINFMFLLERALALDSATRRSKQDMQFRRYLSKETANVLAESILFAMARNINKLHNKIKNREKEAAASRILIR